MPKNIVQELLNMSKLRILNTAAYADTVAKKKTRTKGISAPMDYKTLCRKQKRKLCTQEKQLNRLRMQKRKLTKQVKDLKETVQQLLQGNFDITLAGGSQEDMETLLLKCNASEKLASEIQSQDSTGTLDLFWQEQLVRASNPVKRRQWNPIVLRYCVHVEPQH